MIKTLQQAWYSGSKWVWCLAPLSVLFWALSSLRRLLFRLGLLSSKGSNIPVVVVGNIGIGGNGKTPLVLALVQNLVEKGYSPAVLSRGYGGKQTQFPYIVNINDSAQLVGDEPALIVKRENTLIVIDPVRARGVEFVENNTNANVIICDDGLQHYAMRRDIELCVLDKRGIGNAYLLPMGPLREGIWRLENVDAIIKNIGFDAPQVEAIATEKGITKEFGMTLRAIKWVNIKSSKSKSVDEFKLIVEQKRKEGIQVDAIAGIGDPKRFFDTLKTMDINTQTQTGFADHYQFGTNDLPVQNMVLMTEKDAVKCIDFAHDNCWYLEISADLPKEFFDLIEKGIETKAKHLAQSRA